MFSVSLWNSPSHDPQIWDVNSLPLKCEFYCKTKDCKPLCLQTVIKVDALKRKEGEEELAAKLLLNTFSIKMLNNDAVLCLP